MAAGTVDNYTDIGCSCTALLMSRILDYAWRILPYEHRGGDVFDVIAIDDGRAVVYLADVCGHDEPSADTAARIQHLLSRKTTDQPVNRLGIPLAAVGQVVDALNDEFQVVGDNDRFFTLLYGVVDRPARSFRFVSAGSPGFIRSSADNPGAVITVPGFPVGVSESPEYESATVPLEIGDRYVFYSDGLVEARNPDQRSYSPQALARLVTDHHASPVGELVDSSIDRLQQWTGASGFTDDVSILAFELSDPGDQRA